MLARLFDRSGDASHRVAALWSRLLCRWNGITVNIRGLEHIEGAGARIFTANHQGYFDIFALSGFLPAQLRWVAKSSLFFIPFVGWSMWASGYVPVDRGNKKKAYQAFLATVDVLKAGKSVVIFPEGTRSADGSVGPFKKGGHLLALRSGAPMIPVAINGSGDILRKGSFWVHSGSIDITLFPAVDMERMTAEEKEGALDRIRAVICASLGKN